MRPHSLAEVAQLAADGDDFDRCLANFLDSFYAAPTGDALGVEPELLTPRFGEIGKVRDAYLAAVAEEVSRRFGLPQPAWTWAENRQLKHPWFATPMASVRAVLLLESPAGFRSRNLFVSENALSRL